MILVTGGAGFIGSHTCTALAAAGIPYLVLDNFCNSRPGVLERIGRITGSVPAHIEGDVRDARLLESVFAQYPITGVIHFAGLKAVGESVREPLRYYDNNVAGTVALLRAMQTAGVRTLVFSSSATVYGESASVPIREDFALSATNPYGWSKLMMEQVLADVDTAAPGQWRIARLRYFNPVGAHDSGLIGEDPQDVPNNLLPYAAQVAAGQRAAPAMWRSAGPTPRWPSACWVGAPSTASTACAWTPGAGRTAPPANWPHRRAELEQANQPMRQSRQKGIFSRRLQPQIDRPEPSAMPRCKTWPLAAPPVFGA